jgi:hypothetical protein
MGCRHAVGDNSKNSGRRLGRKERLGVDGYLEMAGFVP